MYTHLEDKNFTIQPKYQSGKYGICPLNETGFENYLNYNSYNYHYLNKFDPSIIKEYLNDVEEGKRIAEEKKMKAQMQNKQINIQPNQTNTEAPPTIVHPPCNEQQQPQNKDPCYLQQQQPQSQIPMKKQQQCNKPKPSKNKRSPFNNNTIKFNNPQTNSTKSAYVYDNYYHTYTKAPRQTYAQHQQHRQPQMPLIATTSSGRSPFQ